MPNVENWSNEELKKEAFGDSTSIEIDKFYSRKNLRRKSEPFRKGLPQIYENEVCKDLFKNVWNILRY